MFWPKSDTCGVYTPIVVRLVQPVNHVLLTCGRNVSYLVRRHRATLCGATVAHLINAHTNRTAARYTGRTALVDASPAGVRPTRSPSLSSLPDSLSLPPSLPPPGQPLPRSSSVLYCLDRQPPPPISKRLGWRRLATTL